VPFGGTTLQLTPLCAHIYRVYSVYIDKLEAATKLQGSAVDVPDLMPYVNCKKKKIDNETFQRNK